MFSNATNNARFTLATPHFIVIQRMDAQLFSYATKKCKRNAALRSCTAFLIKAALGCSLSFIIILSEYTSALIRCIKDFRTYVIKKRAAIVPTITVVGISASITKFTLHNKWTTRIELWCSGGCAIIINSNETVQELSDLK